MSISALYGTSSGYTDWASASSRRSNAGGSDPGTPKAAEGTTAPTGTDGRAQTSTSGSSSITQLSPAEAQEVADLKAADQKVRAHEQAHQAAAGGLASSGASFSYQRGPDGQRYAISGEVSIDTSKGSSPQETISRASRIEAAALAPADPSPQDRRVAATAAQMKAQAEAQLRAEQLAAQKTASTDGKGSNSTYTANGSSSAAGTGQDVGNLVNTYA